MSELELTQVSMQRSERKVREAERGAKLGRRSPARETVETNLDNQHRVLGSRSLGIGAWQPVGEVQLGRQRLTTRSADGRSSTCLEQSHRLLQPSCSRNKGLYFR